MTKKKTKNNSVLKTVIGAIIGTGIAAGAFLMKDKKNRDNVKKVLSKIEKKIQKPKTVAKKNVSKNKKQ